MNSFGGLNIFGDTGTVSQSVELRALKRRNENLAKKVLENFRRVVSPHPTNFLWVSIFRVKWKGFQP